MQIHFCCPGVVDHGEGSPGRFSFHADRRTATPYGSRGLQQLNLSPPIHVSKETILELWHAVTHGEALRYGDDYSLELEGSFSKSA